MNEERPEDQIKKRFDDFAEEMENLGKKLEKEGKRLSERLDNQGKQMETWFQRTFGVLGPMLSSIAGLIILGIIIWVFAYLGRQTGNSVFTDISNLFLDNIVWLFSASLLMSYTEYGNRKAPHYFKWLSPLTTAAGLTILLWVLANIFIILGRNTALFFFPSLSAFINGNITAFFFLFLILGYLIFFSIEATRSLQPPHLDQHVKKPETQQEPPYTQSSNIKRLYRSGKDKILGGVCGGIADYLSIDPVIIRILWIIATLAWGTGVLLYIILWIIIPRNPDDKWF